MPTDAGRLTPNMLPESPVIKSSAADSCACVTHAPRLDAGEDAEEVKPVMKKLHDHKVGSILDYAAEADLGSVPVRRPLSPLAAFRSSAPPVPRTRSIKARTPAVFLNTSPCVCLQNPSLHGEANVYVKKVRKA